MEAALKELVKKILTDNLEIKISEVSDIDGNRLEVYLDLFGETISSDWIGLRRGI